MGWQQKQRSPGPRKARGGIKSRSARGESIQNWWARRWIKAMENIMDGARLQRGRRYARGGQVLSMEERDGMVVARVQGSRSKPYKVTLRLTPFNDEQWEKVLDVLSGRAIFAAQLLAGEMPVTIEEAFASAGINLFPVRSHDLITECSCPDWANPCKHVAATHFVLGDRFDEDPFLLFRLRGRSQDQILEGLRRHRGEHADFLEEDSNLEFSDEALDREGEDKLVSTTENEPVSLESYWQLNQPLEDFSLVVKPPHIKFPILQRLGEPDIAGHYQIEKLLGEAYQITSQAAMIIAYHGEEVESDDKNNNHGNGH